MEQFLRGSWVSLAGLALGPIHCKGHSRGKPCSLTCALSSYWSVLGAVETVASKVSYPRAKHHPDCPGRLRQGNNKGQELPEVEDRVGEWQKPG